MTDSFQARRVAAFFDLDGTLVPRPSLERQFFDQLRYRGRIPARNYFLWLFRAVRLLPRGIAGMVHANKSYLRRVAVRGPGNGPWRPAGGHFAFFPGALERVLWHARQSHQVHIVSGTLAPLAQLAAEELERQALRRGVRARFTVWATCLREEHGCWTGEIGGQALVGEAKARTVRRIAAEEGLDLRNCYAYGDSSLDRWILSAVGRPAAVNPSARLRRIAMREGWPILEWTRTRPASGQKGNRP